MGPVYIHWFAIHIPILEVLKLRYHTAHSQTVSQKPFIHTHVTSEESFVTLWNCFSSSSVGKLVVC